MASRTLLLRNNASILKRVSSVNRWSRQSKQCSSAAAAAIRCNSSHSFDGAESATIVTTVAAVAAAAAAAATMGSCSSPTDCEVIMERKTIKQPRNVMLHRMRSLRARNLNDKYRVDWDKVLGEGAYGSVHPARLAATGEKVSLLDSGKKRKKRVGWKYSDANSC